MTGRVEREMILTVFRAGCSIAVGMLLVLAWGCAGSSTRRHAGVEEGVARMAVLPLETLVSDRYAGEKVRAIVITELLRQGVDVVEPGEVARVLKGLNLSSAGALTVADLRVLGKELDVERVIAGSVSAYGMSRGISALYPEVSVHLMVLDVSTGEIIRSVWRTGGGPGFWTRHFGAEGTTLSETAREVVQETIDILIKGEKKWTY